MIIDKACFERGCACYDDRVDGPGVEVVEKTEKQEPVAWCVLEPWLSGKFEAQDCFSDVALDANVGWVPLYTTPQPQEFVCSTGLCHYKNASQREWVGLTDEEIQEIALELPMDAVRITEAKLKEKNT
ncbi:MAG: hypothetical protein EBW87_03750 [Burkholderiaceae bacterium]|nr:hypothetical protein [Burkholderiaceae bacterium]